ncbi:MAG: alpha/beta hydrolase [Sandaracinaceae bacterium]|nr:MAG: alpha/beta hydrolase [Sandaracinaceae bacterium]
MTRWLMAAFVLGLAGCGAIREAQRDALFHPERTQPRPELAETEGLERWWLDVEGGEVECWFLPGPADAGPGPAVVVAHGNAELIEDWLPRVAPYREMGLSVLLPEYRSYGRSGGTPGEAAILGDFAHFYDRMVDRPEVDPTRVVFHGYSLGGGVLGALSDRRRARALILESTFTNVADVASHYMAPMGAITDRFDTRAVLSRGSTPVLLMHGVDDAVIPFRHAVELDRVAWDSRLVAFDAGHDDLPRGEVYWRTIRAFLTETGMLSRR